MISISPLTATNKVNDAHLITATVKQNSGNGSGFVNAPDGTSVTFSLLNNTAGATFVGAISSCTTTAGTCSVSINTATTGSVDINAATTFSVLGVSLTRMTGDGLSGDSVNGHKTYVDARIVLSPLTATNNIQSPHTITATVSQDLGNGGGFVAAPDGTLVTFSLLNNTAGAAFIPTAGSNTCTTTAGTCSVQINSNTPGSVDIHATTTFNVAGVSITRASGDGLSGDSANANKLYVSAKITIVKDAQPNDLQDFAFTGLGSFSLDDDQSVFGADNVLLNSKVFSNQIPGTYSITETLPNSFWQFNGVTCVNTDGETPYTNITNVPNGVTVNLVANADVTCTFVNVKISPTRTLGFWQTHTTYTSGVFTSAPISSSMPIGTALHKGFITTVQQLFGAFFSNIAKTTLGTKRVDIDKARMQLLQQLVAAKLNCANFGCAASVQTMITAADAAYAGNSASAILASAGALDAFNNSGDTMTIGPAGSATPNASKALADYVFWNAP
jgi:hypothetical protein